MLSLQSSHKPNGTKPAVELASASVPAHDVQLLTESLLLDFEVGMKQSLEQLAGKLEEEIKALLAQSSSSAMTISQNSALACNGRSEQKSNEGMVVPTLALQQIVASSQKPVAPQETLASWNTSPSAAQDWAGAISPYLEERQTHAASVSHAVKEHIQKQRAHSLEYHESRWRRSLYRFVQSKRFTTCCILIVVANAVWLGYEVDHRSRSDTGWMKAVSLSFNIWFLLELAIRIAGLRSAFILGPDSSWNLIDGFCVLLSVPDFFSSAMNVSFLRMVRLCKLAKGLRLVRVLQFVTSLRIILTTIFYTLGSLFWSFVAMLFAAYIFAILMVQALSLKVDGDVPLASETSENFGTVYKAILALFSMITGGQDWYGFAQDLRRCGAHIAEYVLMLWIFFATFGLINVVVAVFCAQAVEAGETQRSLRLQKENETRTSKINELMDIFRMIDTVNRGWITWEQFHAFGTNPQGQIILESNDCHLFALQEQWHIMVGRNDKRGRADATSFVQSFLRLSTECNNTNILLLSQRVKGLRTELRESFHRLHNELKENRVLEPEVTHV